MKRYGTVAEIAKTAAFLLSEDAGYITGQNIRVDGGITRSCEPTRPGKPGPARNYPGKDSHRVIGPAA